jgi:hypothetical protein
MFLQTAVRNYESGLGDNVVTDLIKGAGGVVSGVTGGIDTIKAKADKLEFALTTILILSGVAATTGLVNLLRRR